MDPVYKNFDFITLVTSNAKRLFIRAVGKVKNVPPRASSGFKPNQGKGIKNERPLQVTRYVSYIALFLLQQR